MKFKTAFFPRILISVAILLVCPLVVFSQDLTCTSGLSCPAGQGKVQKPNFVVTVNGCGPAILNLDNVIPEFKFGACCDGHDRCWSNCSVTKEACDEEFFQCMNDKCDELSGNGIIDRIRHRICLGWSECYASVVSQVAFCPLWSASQDKACECGVVTEQRITNTTTFRKRNLTCPPNLAQLLGSSPCILCPSIPRLFFISLLILVFSVILM